LGIAGDETKVSRVSGDGNCPSGIYGWDNLAFPLQFGVGENAGSDLVERIGRGTDRAHYIFDTDLITVGEASMVRPWIAEPV
jgi:hypothetical protein